MDKKKSVSDDEMMFGSLLIITIVLGYFQLFWLALLFLLFTILSIPKLKWKIKGVLSIPLCIFLIYVYFFIPKPIIKVMSPLNNGENTSYTLQVQVQNATSVSINDEEQKKPFDLISKIIQLDNPETKIHIRATNLFLLFSFENIIIKRSQTKEEMEVKKIDEEKQQIDEEKQKMKDKFDVGTAKVECKKSIKSLLNYPKTAQFHDVKDFFTATPEKEAIIKGKVEGKNAFGVPIESYFECVFTYDKEKENYSYKYQLYE